MARRRLAGAESDDVVLVVGLRDVLDFRCVDVGGEVEFLRLGVDLGAGRDGPGQEDVTADDGVVADDGLAAEDGRVRVDGDVVLDGRVTADVEEPAAFFQGQSAERDALVDGATVADLCRFTDHNAHAVVDEKASAYLCTGVYLDISLLHAVLRYSTCKKKHFTFIAPMSSSVSSEFLSSSFVFIMFLNFSRNHSSETLTISLGPFAFNQAVLTLTALVCEILSNPSKENHPSASGEIPVFSISRCWILSK